MRNNYTPLNFCFGHQCLFPFRAWLLALCALFVGTAYAQTATDPDPNKVDNDGDGLIEIWTLAQLDHMRHNLAGTSYKNTSGATGETTGCGTTLTGAKANKCHGYELMNDLDFSDPTATGYDKAWDGEVQMPNGAGWTPIGDGSTQFTGTFEGNGHAIYNLYVNKTAASGILRLGLFGYAGGATLRNLGLTGPHMSVKGTNTGTGGSDGAYVGALTGQLRDGDLRNCYATGGVVSTAEASFSVAGGLVGYAVSSSADVSIGACYATGAVEARTGTDTPWGGGLVGYANNSASHNFTLRNCYVVGTVKVTGSGTKHAGGLVGEINKVTPTNSYHSGKVTGTTDSGAGTKKTEAELKAPAGAEGIYADWSAKNWFFGSSKDLPRLRIYKEDANGEQVTAGLLRGQGDWSLDADGMVVELRQLAADYEADTYKDIAVNGDDYLRVKKLVQDVGKISDKADKTAVALKADVGASYTKAEADGKFALKTAMTTAQTDITALKSGKADADSVYTKAAVDEKVALKADKTALEPKAEKTAFTALDTKVAAAAVGEKPDSGTADTVWKELAAIKTAIPEAVDLSVYTKQSDLEAKSKELDALKKEVAALKSARAGGGGGSRVEAVRLETRVVVRPNPAGEMLVIASAAGQLYKIIDTAGRILMEGRIASAHEVLELSHLRAGQYVVFLQKGAASATHVFVKE